MNSLFVCEGHEVRGKPEAILWNINVLYGLYLGLSAAIIFGSSTNHVDFSKFCMGAASK